jgi:alpha-maltose-1-phosphate synthase
MLILSHPTGNANVRQAARALNDAGLLSEFWTTICWNEDGLLNRALPSSVNHELRRRAFSGVGRVHCHPWIELGRLAARQLNFASVTGHESKRFSIDAVYRSLDSRVAKRLYEVPHIRGLYAYEDGALAGFRAARQLGIKTIYELPIGYWRCYQELIEVEASLQPEWAVTLQGNSDSEEKLRRKDEELSLASDIVVASDFVRDTLRKAGPLQARVSVHPYGAPARPNCRTEPVSKAGKLRVLFVGALSQRKGLSYLLQAVAPFRSEIELTLVGRKVAECRPLDEALRVHRWIPSLPHGALLLEMSRHDVMVFPSLFEGCALVVLEAMSQGVPVITTTNSGATHFVNDGEDGFIVAIRDVESIQERLERLIRDRARLAAMGQAAVRKVSKHSWEQYRSCLVATIRSALMNDYPAESPADQPPHPEVCPPC